jgi:hypothetical protein
MEFNIFNKDDKYNFNIFNKDDKYNFNIWKENINHEHELFEKQEDSIKKSNIKIILKEANNMISSGSYTSPDTDKDKYLIMTYELDNKYQGHIFYIIKDIPENQNYVYGFDENDIPLRTNDAIRVMFFISIYKSLESNVKNFSTIMLDKLKWIAVNNRCSLMYTKPIGKMETLLKDYGFIHNIFKINKPNKFGSPFDSDIKYLLK